MGHKPRRERIMATRDKRIPLCKGANYHVFGLGAAKCSVCGWDRYAGDEGAGRALDSLEACLEAANATVKLNGKPISGPGARQAQLEAALHPAWVVLRWDCLNERNTVPGITYAVVAPKCALINRAWYHETLGWCPHGGSMISLFADDIEQLRKLLK